jgi:hypothetical protein
MNSNIIDGSKVGILSFCGVGLALGGLQIDEFRKTFDGDGSLVFFKDLKRSWWNNRSFEHLLDIAIAHLRYAGCERLFAIGNSMGGTGALLASHLRRDIERVYAFVPQADPYADDRWNEYTDCIEHIRWPNFADLTYHSDIHIFMGDHGKDAFQVDHFEKAGKPIRFVERAGHNVAQLLKERGEYSAIIDNFLK